MKKKGLIVIVGMSILFAMLVFGSFASKAGALLYTPCPNGCYEGKSECFCHTWAKNEEDARTGGKTDLMDCFYIDDFPSY